MAEPTVVVTGVYWVRPAFRALREAMRCQGNSATVRMQLGSLALVELEVRDVTEPPDLSLLHQVENENVPYDEVYFSLDRHSVLGKAFARPSSRDFAVAFYLHAFNPRSPLQTPWGQLSLPEPTWERPQHLSSLRYDYFD